MDETLEKSNNMSIYPVKQCRCGVTFIEHGELFKHQRYCKNGSEHMVTEEYVKTLTNGRMSNAYDYVYLHFSGRNIGEAILETLLKSPVNRIPVLIRLHIEHYMHLMREHGAQHGVKVNKIHDVKFVKNYSNDEKSIIVFTKPLPDMRPCLENEVPKFEIINTQPIDITGVLKND